MQSKESWLSPVPQKKLSRMVTDKITEALSNGQIKPGDYLPSENQLAESLGVGKSSVREAIKMLEAVGVVEIIKGHGSRVRTVIDSHALNPLAYQLILQGNKNQEKLVEFRRIIEGAASCLATKMITEEEISALEKLHQQMEKNAAANINNLELDIQFHEYIYSATQNPFFACVGSALMMLFKPTMSISNTVYPYIVLENHARILKALKERNETAMQEAILHSINKWNTLSMDQ
ncbi:MAG: FadR/GntR family transcriptional regulator [Eubacteriales bacterium]|nr:FadR/GntR family transcriptional regulator [Eubacteriales bacterium]